MKIPVQESCRAKIQIQENTGNTGTARGLDLFSLNLGQKFIKKGENSAFACLSLFGTLTFTDPAPFLLLPSISMY